MVFANGRAYVSVSQYDQVRVYDVGTLALLATIPINSRMPRALRAARTARGVRRRLRRREPHLGARSPAGDRCRRRTPDEPEPAGGAACRAIIQQQPNGNWVDETEAVEPKARYSVLDADVSEISTASNTVTRTLAASAR